MKTKAINYNDYIGTYQEDMAQRFADGELTDIEELKKFIIIVLGKMRCL